MVPLSMTLSDLCPGIQGHDIFWSQISEKRHVLKTKLLLHKRKVTYKCRTENYDTEARIRPCERHKSQFIFDYHLYEISYTSEKKN